jgi:hypothetical protein
MANSLGVFLAQIVAELTTGTHAPEQLAGSMLQLFMFFMLSQHEGAISAPCLSCELCVCPCAPMFKVL